jgi:hypothetical protein
VVQGVCKVRSGSPKSRGKKRSKKKDKLVRVAVDPPIVAGVRKETADSSVCKLTGVVVDPPVVSEVRKEIVDLSVVKCRRLFVIIDRCISDIIRLETLKTDWSQTDKVVDVETLFFWRCNMFGCNFRSLEACTFPFKSMSVEEQGVVFKNPEDKFARQLFKASLEKEVSEFEFLCVC